ncbi:MAG: CYTH domain-containing protein [Burkholderiales bacterium]
MSAEIEPQADLSPEVARAPARELPWRPPRSRARTPSAIAGVHYDTPEHALAQSRVQLRVRKQGRRWVQTVKEEGR